LAPKGGEAPGILSRKIENIYIVINLFSATYVFKVYAYGRMPSPQSGG